MQYDAGCGKTVLVFGDSDSACSTQPMRCAIGAASSQFKSWGQCAGWPQTPNYAGCNFLPDNFRIWLR